MPIKSKKKNEKKGKKLTKKQLKALKLKQEEEAKELAEQEAKRLEEERKLKEIEKKKAEEERKKLLNGPSVYDAANINAFLKENFATLFDRKDIFNKASTMKLQETLTNELEKTKKLEETMINTYKNAEILDKKDSEELQTIHNAQYEIDMNIKHTNYYNTLHDNIKADHSLLNIQTIMKKYNTKSNLSTKKIVQLQDTVDLKDKKSKILLNKQQNSKYTANERKKLLNYAKQRNKRMYEIMPSGKTLINKSILNQMNIKKNYLKNKYIHDQRQQIHHQNKKIPCYFKAIPSIVKFTNYKENNEYCIAVKLKNISNYSRRLHVHSAKTKLFRIDPPIYPTTFHLSDDTRAGLLAPGMSAIINVWFKPESLAHVDDELIVSTEDYKIFKIPLQGRRDPPLLTLTPNLYIGECINTQSISRIFNIKNIGSSGEFWILSMNDYVNICKNISNDDSWPKVCNKDQYKQLIDKFHQNMITYQESKKAKLLLLQEQQKKEKEKEEEKEQISSSSVVVIEHNKDEIKDEITPPINNDDIEIESFYFSKATFKLDKDAHIELDILFKPLTTDKKKSIKYQNDFIILTNNYSIQKYTVIGNSISPIVDIQVDENNINYDETSNTIKFANTTINSTQDNIISLYNPTIMSYNYRWNIEILPTWFESNKKDEMKINPEEKGEKKDDEVINQNITNKEEKAEEEEEEIEENEDNNQEQEEEHADVFSVNNIEGILESDETIDFTFTFTPFKGDTFTALATFSICPMNDENIMLDNKTVDLFNIKLSGSGIVANIILEPEILALSHMLIGKSYLKDVCISNNSEADAMFLWELPQTFPDPIEEIENDQDGQEKDIDNDNKDKTDQEIHIKEEEVPNDQSNDEEMIKDLNITISKKTGTIPANSVLTLQLCLTINKLGKQKYDS